MPREEGTVFVYNKTKETFLAYRVKVADSILSRLVGLLGKRSLALDSGLWIVPSSGVHTLGMLFTIDVVFLDKNLKVVGLRELLRPFSITGLNLQADSVIELPAHTIFKSRTEIGDALVVSSHESALTANRNASGVQDFESTPKVTSAR
ncbi:MAG: DUF192 domain-containing protein [Acidobacteria bacterium]|nr:MAG: DUF192 domain-containing protein [Acidobacteriota bacterium]PYV24818.1 MAG: DUF192 domain-containing protein [Acidobacteriota bacterium]